ncbi:hypothetical protein VNO77_23183 [Canavalia gladiata]|uniref:Uncharacterized protein n=1 Tax=Canavalia gladiata TaxID=3824 RepID=A0AAN9L7B6_CANGL
MQWFKRLLPGTIHLNPAQICSNVDLGAVWGYTVRELTKVPDRFHSVLPSLHHVPVGDHSVTHGPWEILQGNDEVLLLEIVVRSTPRDRALVSSVYSWSCGLMEMKTFGGWYAKLHKAAGLHGFHRLCLHTFSAHAHMMAQSQGMVLRLGAGVIVSGKEAATIANQAWCIQRRLSNFYNELHAFRVSCGVDGTKAAKGIEDPCIFLAHPGYGKLSIDY